MYFPRKTTVALAVAATFAGGAFTTAYAGNASATYNTFATEAAKANTLGTVTSPSLSYQPHQVISNSTLFTIYIKLNGGATWSSTNVPASGATTVPVYSGNTNSATYEGGSVSSNGTVLALKFKNNSGGPISTSGVFSLNAISNLLNLSNASKLKTSGSKITGTFALANGYPNSPVTFPSSPADTASGTIAEAQQAINTYVVNSGTFKANYTSSNNLPMSSDEGQFIDVNPTSELPLTRFTSGALTNSSTLVNLGAIYLTNTSGTQLGGNGNNGDFTVNSDLTKLSFDMKGNFLSNGQETIGLYSDKTCSTKITSANTQINSNGSSVKVSYSGSTGFLTQNNPYYVCIKASDVSGGNSKDSALPATQPSIPAVNLYKNTNLVDGNGSGKLYNLTANGTQVTLVNYVPSEAAPYQTYLRVANNGNVSAPVTVQVIGKNGNTLGSGQLGTLSAGAAQTFSASKVENAAGVSLSSNNRPQIKLSAPTNHLDVQSYLDNGNGNFTNMTSNKTDTSSGNNNHNPN